MSVGNFDNLENIATDRQKVEDRLLANSNLTRNEYFMPIPGLIFLQYATNRLYEPSGTAA